MRQYDLRRIVRQKRTFQFGVFQPAGRSTSTTGCTRSVFFPKDRRSRVRRGKRTRRRTSVDEAVVRNASENDEPPSALVSSPGLLFVPREQTVRTYACFLIRSGRPTLPTVRTGRNIEATTNVDVLLRSDETVQRTVPSNDDELDPCNRRRRRRRRNGKLLRRDTHTVDGRPRDRDGDRRSILRGDRGRSDGESNRRQNCTIGKGRRSVDS